MYREKRTMMLLNIFGFLNISFADILDILMVAIFIYLAFRWIRGSAAMNIFVAVILLFVLRVIVAAFNMKLMSALLGTFIDVGVIALIVIFQPEVRHFLMKLGSRYGVAGEKRRGKAGTSSTSCWESKNRRWPEVQSTRSLRHAGRCRPTRQEL